jgi:hypothetical protein
MRAPALVTLIVLCLSSEARAEEMCTFTDPGHKPRLFFIDSELNYRASSVLDFHVYFPPMWSHCLCQKNERLNKGRPSVEFQFLVGDKVVDRQPGKQLYKRKYSNRGPHTLIGRLFPGQICDRIPHLDGRRFLQGPPGHEFVMQMVPVRARVVAKGELTPLNYTSEVVEFPCWSCRHLDDGSIGVRAESDGSLVLKAEVSREWFECAGFQATLNLSGFVGKSEDEVERAIRPDFAWEGLEKAFKREGDKYVLRKPLPMAQLCKMGKTWGFDLWGRGELSRSAHGGRAVYELPCH